MLVDSHCHLNFPGLRERLPEHPSRVLAFGLAAGVVFADCDLEAAVDGIARAAFLNCGQVCLGTERVYVERPIFERFVAGLKDVSPEALAEATTRNFFDLFPKAAIAREAAAA